VLAGVPSPTRADAYVTQDVTELNLGSTPATVPSASQRVTFSNGGPDSATISASEIQGPGAADFSIAAETCTDGPLAAWESCYFDVLVAPHDIGSVTATLVVTGDAWVGTRTVSLSGVGTDPVSSPSYVSYGTLGEGAARDRAIVLSSVATETIPVGSIAIFGSGFSLRHNGCAGGIPAQGSCSIVIGLTVSSPTVPFNAFYSGYIELDDPGLLAFRRIDLRGRAVLPRPPALWRSAGQAARRWNFGNGLAEATNGATKTLVQSFSSSHVGSVAVQENGPKMPVYVSGSTNDGASWTTPSRINPTNQHGIWPAIAASGKHVAVAWAHVGFLSDITGVGRVLYVRVSGNSGTGAWGTARRLTSFDDQIDRPAIAMSGTVIVIVYTDSKSGAVKAAISKNRGATWTTVSIGTTTLASELGRTGLASVAIDGQTIGVAWVAGVGGDGGGIVHARVSTNAGSSWGTATPIATDAVDGPSVAATAGRLGVGWSDGIAPRFVERSAGTWSPVRIVIAPWMTVRRTYQLHYSQTLVFHGATRVGMAWSACYQSCFTPGSTPWVDLLWAESADGGASWKASQLLASANSERTFNDDPSIVWTAVPTRYVLYNSWGDTSSYLGFVVGDTRLRPGPRTGLALAAPDDPRMPARAGEPNPVGGRMVDPYMDEVWRARYP
jgi:hypothetical protein